MIFSVFVIKVFDYRCITCIYALNKKVLKHNFLNVCMKETCNILFSTLMMIINHYTLSTCMIFEGFCC